MDDAGTDLRRRFEAQRAHKWTAKQRTVAERRKLLHGLRAGVAKHADAIAVTLASDLGKPAEGPITREVAAVLAAIDDALDNLATWAVPTQVQPSSRFPLAVTEIRLEARGTVLILGPWNYPFQLLFEPLVPTLAAGNTAILKPNELAPATSRVSAEIVAEVFDPADVTLVEGGVETANELLGLPFDHVFFTGSPRVGKRVMQAAAEHLASVTLELGGKCPCIVHHTGDLELAAARVAEGRLLNAGQVCIAPDYVFIPSGLRDAFVTAYLGAVKTRHYPDGTFIPETMSRIINDDNAARILDLCNQAIAGGASAFGVAGAISRYENLEPVVLLDVPTGAAAMQDEIFGPVLPIVTFDDMSEVIDAVRKGPKPLAMYIFSDDAASTEQILAGTSSGGVTVNGWASHYRDPSLPFGGVNHSGHGRYHGIHGFRELSHERAILMHAGSPNTSGPQP